MSETEKTAGNEQRSYSESAARLVNLDFNPSANPEVTQIKTLAAQVRIRLRLSVLLSKTRVVLSYTPTR